jgi:hypothetical protein
LRKIGYDEESIATLVWPFYPIIQTRPLINPGKNMGVYTWLSRLSIFEQNSSEEGVEDKESLHGHQFRSIAAVLAVFLS